MSNNTRDWEPGATYTSPLADENDPENEIAQDEIPVDVQEQNGLPELDQREQQEETDEQSSELPHQQ